jgi:hypothetical protein
VSSSNLAIEEFALDRIDTGIKSKEDREAAPIL